MMKLSLFLIILIGSICCNAQSFNSGKIAGHYWGNNGEKYAGEIKHIIKTKFSGGNIIKFYRNGKSLGKVTKATMSSFVIGADSFPLINNFSVSSLAFYESDFAKVEQEGKIFLYLHSRKVKQSTGMPGSIPIAYLEYTYVVRAENSNVYIGIYNKKRFELDFIPMIKDNQALYDKIMATKKKDWVANLPFYIKQYNEE